MSLYLGENLVSGIAYPVEPSRNIGQIIQSTIPLTDAGLHLLDGSLVLGDGIYSDFVDYIASIYDASANYFCSEADWQTSVTTYGVCGKFVYDSVANTVRLPKITGFVEGASGVANLGDLTEAGLPNITATWSGMVCNGYTTSGAVDKLTNSNGGVGGNSNYGYSFDASRSSSIYGNSNTVQPQSVKVLYYIVIATTTKTEIEVDIDDVVTDLNSKVNTADLTEVQCVVETYVNGTSWYRVYSDGWCEQGGYASKGSEGWLTISLLKNFANTNYNLSITPYSTNTSTYMAHEVKDKTISDFAAYMIVAVDWQACGYIS